MQKLKKFLTKSKVLLILAVCVGIFFIWFFSKTPTNNKDWQVQNQVLPTAVFNGDQVTVSNVRDFIWRTETEFTPGYKNETYDLSKLHKVWFLVSHFSRWSGAAHTMLSFEFSDGKTVNISVEARKSKGESYSFLAGILRQYTLTYVIASESDSVYLRTNVWKEKVYMYPVKTTQEKAKALFVDMLNRANSLADKPEFYNTFASSCTTNIVDHVNKITPNRIPLSIKYFFPGYSDELAYNIGLIDTELQLEDARKNYELPAPVPIEVQDKEFSKKLRLILQNNG